MRRLTHGFFALLLAALWLPATLHCDLQAAELFAAHADACCAGEAGDGCEAGHGDEAPCANDSCEVVEDGAYRPSHDTLCVAAPELSILTDLAELWCALAVETTAVRVARPAESPPEIGRAWQFVQRAAQPPRAPALRV